jgi:predicted dehydrogenase
MVNTIIIGLGNIGLLYDINKHDCIFSHTKACLSHKDINLLYGIDPDNNKRKLFTEITGKTAYSSIDSIQADSEHIDLVIISTPSTLRSEIVARVILLKPACILMEKPIATSYNEAIAIIQQLKTLHIHVLVNYFRYFIPKIQNIQNFIKDRGRVLRGVCHYSGGLINNASHYISLILQLMGHPESVSVVEDCKRQTSSDYHIMFKMNYEYSSILFIPMFASNYDIGEVDLLLEKGRVRLENYGEDIYCYESREDKFFKGYQRLEKVTDALPHPELTDYQYTVIDRICSMFSREIPWESNADNALSTIEICEKVIYESKGSTGLP